MSLRQCVIPDLTRNVVPFRSPLKTAGMTAFVVLHDARSDYVYRYCTALIKAAVYRRGCLDKRDYAQPNPGGERLASWMD